MTIIESLENWGGELKWGRSITQNLTTPNKTAGFIFAHLMSQYRSWLMVRRSANHVDEAIHYICDQQETANYTVGYSGDGKSHEQSPPSPLHAEAFAFFGTSDISILCKMKLRLPKVKSLAQGPTDRNAKSQLQESELLCPLFLAAGHTKG